MAQPRRKTSTAEAVRAAPQQPPAAIAATARHLDAAAPSPALGLQQRLGQALVTQPLATDGPRWSPRATLLVCGGVSLGIWFAIGAGIAALIHAL